MPNPISKSSQNRVLVLGAYGLIGAAVSRRLIADGCRVTGLGRSKRTADSVLPGISWVIRDLADLCDEGAWRPLLEDVDVVVNCSGALQQGGRDDLEVVHQRAVAALAQACRATGSGVIQISAVGARPDAATAFLRSKAAGDAAVREAGIDHWIFRPGLVLGPTAYGGSTLLRMLAAVPWVQPLALPEAAIQTVGLADLAEACALAVKGKLPPGMDCDLVEAAPHSLRDVVRAQRRWLGFQAARREIVLPRWLLAATSRAADALGVLGWRSPLRSTALQLLDDGILGDPAPWTALDGPRLSSMEETLARLPATVEDRLFARMALLMPLAVAVLCLFWLASGVFGFVSIAAAAQVLETAGWSHALAVASVAFWALVDVALAGALLVRRQAARACWGMVMVSLVYLVSATVTVPELWVDPLGPLVKVLPGMVLALVTLPLLETR